MIVSRRKMVIHKWFNTNRVACGARRGIHTLDSLFFPDRNSTLTRPCKRCWRKELLR